MTASQQSVYDAMKEFGRPLPDHALVPLVQHVSGQKLTSSRIRTARAELSRTVVDGGPLVVPVGYVKTGSGRKARTWVAA
jgi:hypothetical protein